MYFFDIVFFRHCIFSTLYVSNIYLFSTLFADPYSETDAATVMKSLFSAVRHLHVSHVQCPSFSPTTFCALQNQTETENLCLLFFYFSTLLTFSGLFVQRLQVEHHMAHRDIKPENILLSSHGSDLDVKIADFGTAVRLPGRRRAHSYTGSPQYMAPEV